MDNKLVVVFTYCIILLIMQIWMKNQEIYKKYSRIVELLVPFALAVTVFVTFTFGDMSMNSSSGDAVDIWKTIKSWHTDEIYGSYVLYKGINAVYPYVWLYDLATFMGVNEWLFVKMFYCFALAYITAIGFPNMIELLTNEKTYCYRRCILVIVLWGFWYSTGAFTQLMIDLPCLFYFIILVNSALKIYRRKDSLWNYIALGIFGGLCMTASGQYTMPAVCIYIFTGIVTLKLYKKRELSPKTILLHIIVIVLCAGCILMANNHFEEKIINTLRMEGAWIPSNNDWLKAGLSRFRNAYRQGGGSSTIPSPRNEAILEAYYNGDIPENITTVEYIKIFVKYPIDFVLNYLNAFFLILSPDLGEFNLVPLVAFYSMIYVAIVCGVTRCKTWGRFFSPLFWIGFSFLWATVPMIVMNIEPRTCMQIQGLIASLAVCDKFVWDKLKIIKDRIQTKNFKSNNEIPYYFILYIAFMLFCILHISTLYELCGNDVGSILVRY